MPDAARDRILTQARVVLAMGGRPTVTDFAHAAGVSRASFYRAFPSRDALLEALQRSPEPDSRGRILEAALELVGEHGLAGLSMDDLADRACVSRATLYRLFAGKSALFSALVHTFSPLDQVIALVTEKQAEPPEVVLPEVARTVGRAVFGDGVNRTGLLRALFFEVTSLAPDAEEATREAVVGVVGALTGYLIAQMSAGRLRQMHPLLALQSFIGPIFFHLMTRPAVKRVLGIEFDSEAVVELARLWLSAMKPEEAAH